MKKVSKATFYVNKYAFNAIDLSRNKRNPFNSWKI